MEKKTVSKESLVCTNIEINVCPELSTNCSFEQIVDSQPKTGQQGPTKTRERDTVLVLVLVAYSMDWDNTATQPLSTLSTSTYMYCL